MTKIGAARITETDVTNTKVSLILVYRSDMKNRK